MKYSNVVTIIMRQMLKGYRIQTDETTDRPMNKLTWWRLRDVTRIYKRGQIFKWRMAIIPFQNLVGKKNIISIPFHFYFIHHRLENNDSQRDISIQSLIFISSNPNLRINLRENTKKRIRIWKETLPIGTTYPWNNFICILKTQKQIETENKNA